jgi:hypothetical protein
MVYRMEMGTFSTHLGAFIRDKLRMGKGKGLELLFMLIKISILGSGLIIIRKEMESSFFLKKMLIMEMFIVGNFLKESFQDLGSIFILKLGNNILVYIIIIFFFIYFILIKKNIYIYI